MVVEALGTGAVNWRPSSPKSAVNISGRAGGARENSALSFEGHGEVHRDSVVRGSQHRAAVTCYLGSKIEFSEKGTQSKRRGRKNKQTNATVVDLWRPKAIRTTEPCGLRGGKKPGIAESSGILTCSGGLPRGVIINTRRTGPEYL